MRIGDDRREDAPILLSPYRGAGDAMLRATLLTLALLFGLPAVSPVQGQQPGAAGSGGAIPATPSADFSGSEENLPPERLEQLVGPVALYPDDILALVLPASTQPLQMVAAQRLLEQRKSDPSVQPPKSWDPSVVGLLNYPEVVAQMNADLIWMQQLGTSVISQQSQVMDAIQSFRKKAHDAGNLKTDDKQTVQVENQTIIVEPANPDVIYVPSYNPATVVYPPQPNYPPPYYYPYPPYPPYYSPAATFFTGMFFGAAIGYGLSWANNGIYHGDVNINNSTNISRGDNTNINRGDRGNRVDHHRENQWKPDRNSVARDQGRLGGAGAGARPSQQDIRSGLQSRGGGPQASLGGPGGARPTAGQLPAGANRGGSSQFGGRGSSQFGGASERGSAFSGARDGAAANRYSARGNQSMRSSGMGSRGGSMSASRGGGGAARGGGGRGGRR
jgi:hypothetical protein